MEKITIRAATALIVLSVFLAIILTGWQGTIQVNSIAGGITLDSRPQVAVHQVIDSRS